MQQKTIYQQLQQHYQKLSSRLQKAKAKGQSLSFQQRILGRIQRCSLQMKQLGAGVAVIAALGVSTPVLGQVDTTSLNYVECMGLNNPFDTITVYQYPYADIRSMGFVDLDGDSDKDMIIANYEYSYTTNAYSTKLYYHENIGSLNNPIYNGRSSNSAVDSIYMNDAIVDITFVDLDGDGDEDLFISPYGAAISRTSSALIYYENTGNASNPVFTMRDSANNPLQDAVNYINTIPFSISGAASIHVDFIDIDNDGLQDCFITPSLDDRAGWPSANNNDKVLYYLNAGVSSTPNFVQQTSANNPLDIINKNNISSGYVSNGLSFADLDRQQDGDLDVAFFFKNPSIAGAEFINYQNIGTSGLPNFTVTTNNLLDSIFLKYGLAENSYVVREIVDITNNGRVEVIAFDGADVRYFKDTNTYTSLVKLIPSSSLHLYPNPSTGFLQLEQELTGSLSVYDAVGRLVYNKELEQADQLDLTMLTTGIYVLHIQTAEEQFVQKVAITQ